MRTLILLTGLSLAACGEPATGMPDGVYRVIQSEMRICGERDWTPCNDRCLGSAGWILKVPHHGHFGDGIAITPCPDAATHCDVFHPFGLPEQPQVSEDNSPPWSEEEGCILGVNENWFEPTPEDAPAALTVFRRRYRQPFAEDCAEVIDLDQAGCLEERTQARYVHR